MGSKRIFCVILGMLSISTIVVFGAYILLAFKCLAVQGNPELFLKEIKAFPEWFPLIAMAAFFIPFFRESRVGMRIIGRSIAR